MRSGGATHAQVLAGNALLPDVLEGAQPFDVVIVGADASGDQLPALLPLVAPTGMRTRVPARPHWRVHGAAAWRMPAARAAGARTTFGCLALDCTRDSPDHWCNAKKSPTFHQADWSPSSMAPSRCFHDGHRQRAQMSW
jgi:hypothetical protein